MILELYALAFFHLWCLLLAHFFLICFFSSLHDFSDIVGFVILSEFSSSFCHRVYLELETCNTMGNHVIPFKRSKPSQLCNTLREMVSAM